MDDMNNSQTDIFGNVTPFQSEAPEEETEIIFEEASPIQENNFSQEVTPQPIESFNEMPFVGVNQQELEESKPILENTKPVVEEYSANSNMEPVQKAEDENAGLKFLLVLGIIFAVVIILLPFI